MDEPGVRELIEKLEQELEGEPHMMGTMYYRGMIRVLKFLVGDTEGYLAEGVSR